MTAQEGGRGAGRPTLGNAGRLRCERGTEIENTDRAPPTEGGSRTERPRPPGTGCRGAGGRGEGWVGWDDSDD